MPKIEAILFDMDGVIIESVLDLAQIKVEIFGSPDIFIIEGIITLPENEREAAWLKVEEMEVEAAKTAIIHPEAAELFDWMDSKGLKRGIITRNGKASIEVIKQRIGRDLGLVVAREDAEPKPAPDGVLLAMEKLGVTGDSTLMVGDFRFDIEAGKSAGCRTVFLRTPKFADLEVDADYEVSSLMDIPGIIAAIEDERTR
jgi:HAD superfamily hydrolase (TIGR01549 family)